MHKILFLNRLFRIQRAWIVGVACCALTGLTAQTTAERQVERAALQPQAPQGNFAPSGNARAGNQGDYATSERTTYVGEQRIVQRYERNFKLHASADSQFYRTSNVYSVEKTSTSKPQMTTVFVNSVFIRAELWNFNLDPFIYTPTLAFAYQNFLHGLGSDSVKPQRDALDFHTYSLSLNNRFRFMQTWEAGLGNTFLLNQKVRPDNDTTYRSLSIDAYLSKYWMLAEAHTLAASLSTKHNFTKEYGQGIQIDDRLDKTDLAFSIAYYWSILESVVLNPYISTQVSWYPEYHDSNLVSSRADRTDWSNSFGLNLSWQLWEFLTLRTYGSYTMRESSNPNQADYQNYDLGLGVNASFSY